MNTTLWKALLQTPTVRNLVERIVDGLAGQVSQLLMLPRTAEADTIQDALRAEALRRDFRIGDICFESQHNELTVARCAQVLQSLSRDADSSPGTLDDLLRDPRLPEVVFISGIDKLSEASQKRFLDILVQWSRISQNAMEQGDSCATACSVIVANEQLANIAKPEVHLNIEWWWGLPTVLETSLVCRDWESVSLRNGKAIWCESLATSLSSGDVTYIAEVWSALSGPFKTLWRKTREYGESLGWTRGEIEGGLKELPAENIETGDADWRSAADSSSPPLTLRPMWSAGMLQLAPEWGCELHPAALALAGRVELLEQRLWRAQASMLLPKLDMIRHGICRRMAHKYGACWPLRWAQPLSDEEREQLNRSHYACQWGYLEHLLRCCPQFRAERPLVPKVSLCREIRNELAHYRPISFDLFEKVWQ